MSAKFLAVGSFYVKSRNLFVIVGDLLEGTIEPGSQVVIPLGNLGLAAPIEGVELIDVTYQDRSYLGLVIDDEGDPESQELLSALKIGDECLEIEVREVTP